MAGVIVKYRAEAAHAAAVLGAPVHVVPNGVPVPAVSPERPGARDRLVLGTAARIHPQKRLEDLLEALRLAGPHLPPWSLRIAGGVETGCADYAARLRAACAGLLVEWLGEVTDLADFHHPKAHSVDAA